MTILMPPGPVSCIGGTKYPHCIVLYCNHLHTRLDQTKLNMRTLDLDNHRQSFGS